MLLDHIWNASIIYAPGAVYIQIMHTAHTGIARFCDMYIL